MSGVTDQPFRRIVRRFGAGLVVSEMIASAAIVQQARKEIRKMSEDYSTDYPLSVQLAGLRTRTDGRRGEAECRPGRGHNRH